MPQAWYKGLQERFGQARARDETSELESMPDSGRGRGIRRLGSVLIVLGGLLLLIVLLFLAGGIRIKTTTPNPTLEGSSPIILRTVTPPPGQTAIALLTALPSPFPTAAPQTEPPVSPGPTSTQEAKPLPTLLLPSPTATPGRLPPAVRIVIPRLGIDAKVLEMGWKPITEGGVRRAEWEVPENAVGHAINSANPGEVGNVVMTGHHNIRGEVFKGLWDAKEGDEIILYAQDGPSYRYVVTHDALILPEKEASEEERRAHTRYMDQTPDSRLTLITCWPYWSNTHRVIVIGLLES